MLVDKLVIHGKKPLKGIVEISGAKNAVLPMMTAALLTEGITTIHKVPDLRDTQTMIRLLEMIGAGVEFENGTLKLANLIECPSDTSHLLGISQLNPLISFFSA